MAGEPLHIVVFGVEFDVLPKFLTAMNVFFIQTTLVHAFIPLNGLRRNMEMEPSDFLAALMHTVSERGPAEWKEKTPRKTGGEGIGTLRHFLRAGQFLRRSGQQGFQILLSERSAVLQGARLLTELRPIYNEATTGTLAQLLTSTLVEWIIGMDGWRQLAAPSVLDKDDLEKLASEVEQAQLEDQGQSAEESG